MCHIKTLNKISPVGLSVLDQTYYTISTDMEGEDDVLVRSAGMHDYVFPNTLWTVARASTGTNNIPVDHCSETGIMVSNTPGVSTNVVKGLAVYTLLLASRKISDDVAWVKEQAAGAGVEQAVERGKNQFVGLGLFGKMLGVIGLGAIGVQMANIATKLGMIVFSYDPFLPIDGALSLSRLVHRTMGLETACKNCDYITLHVPRTPEIKGVFNEDTFRMMKGGVHVLNLARGTLVNGGDMLAALDGGKVAYYVTDFPNGRILWGKNVMATPHLGASTPESEENCAVMATQELGDYLKNGNVQNSVSLPTLVQPWSGVSRLCIIRRNTPGAIASITGVLSRDRVNVANMTDKSKKGYTYTVAGVDSRIGESVADTIHALDVVLRVRLFNC